MAKCRIETLNAILVAVFDATNGLLSAHVPLEAVLRRFPGHLRGNVIPNRWGDPRPSGRRGSQKQVKL